MYNLSFYAVLQLFVVLFSFNLYLLFENVGTGYPDYVYEYVFPLSATTNLFKCTCRKRHIYMYSEEASIFTLTFEFRRKSIFPRNKRSILFGTRIRQGSIIRRGYCTSHRMDVWPDVIFTYDFDMTSTPSVSFLNIHV